MATICPKCWGLRKRVEMEWASMGKVEEYTPVDMFPDRTRIEHPKRTVPSPYGMCTCPRCGYKEKEKDPREGVC